MKSDPWLLRLMLGTALLLSGAGTAATAGPAGAASLQAWKQFRASQPFQIQVIALSPAAAGQPRTLIIAEPPPHVTLHKILDVLGSHGQGCSAQDWRVMAGGFVTDLVCTVTPREPAAWALKLANVQHVVYGAVAEGGVVALPVPRRKMIAHSLDQRFSGPDLLRWASEVKPTLRSSPISPAINFTQMMGRAPGVFYDSERTLVFWVLGRGKSIDAASGDIRRFAVASDLVLGAVAGHSTVAIIGRARKESLAHLPPLRSETVRLLAGSSGDSLHQSYERKHMVAGKGSDGVDRAPIYLSAPLIDTEFGTLLNIADQLLKGWSMAGQVKYLDFTYPAPRSYPFGRRPAYQVEPERRSFLFNFNTDGVAYRQILGQYEVLVPQRTGALSVIYGDVQDRPAKMEATAYDYFATSGDASLARVVQYTLLYQIFKQFDIRASAPTVSARHAQVVQQIAVMRNAQIRAMLRFMSLEQIGDIGRQIYGGMVDRLPGKPDAARKSAWVDGRVTDLLGTVSTLRAANEESGGDVGEALITLGAALERDGLIRAVDQARAEAAFGTLKRYLPEPLVLALMGQRHAEPNVGTLMQIAAQHLSSWDKLEAVADGARTGWTRTADIVKSRGVGVVSAGIGGHNLEAPVIRLVESKAARPGSVAVRVRPNGDLEVTHATSDRQRAGDIARLVSTRKALDMPVIERQVAAELAALPVRPPVALRQVTASAGHSAEFASLKAAESLYRTRALNREEAAGLALLSEAREAIVMEQLADGSFLLKRTGSPDALHISTIAAATDALAHGLLRAAGGLEPVPIYVKGIPEAKAEAMLGQIQSNLRRYDKNSVNSILSLGEREALSTARPMLINAQIAHNGLRVERSAIKLEKITEGVHAGATRATVGITVLAKTPLRWKLIFILKDFTQAKLELLISKVEALLLTLKGPVSPAAVNAAVRLQLAADMKALNIDAILLSTKDDASNMVNGVLIGLHHAPPSEA